MKKQITQERREELTKRYEAAVHAVQTGVAIDQAQGSQDGSPKHLRVGVNLRATDAVGLVNLLIKKGVISEEEYLVAICESAEAEVRRYEELLTRRASGNKVTLL